MTNPIPARANTALLPHLQLAVVIPPSVDRGKLQLAWQLGEPTCLIQPRYVPRPQGHTAIALGQPHLRRALFNAVHGILLVNPGELDVPLEIMEDVWVGIAEWDGNTLKMDFPTTDQVTVLRDGKWSTPFFDGFDITPGIKIRLVEPGTDVGSDPGYLTIGLSPFMLANANPPDLVLMTPTLDRMPWNEPERSIFLPEGRPNEPLFSTALNLRIENYPQVLLEKALMLDSVADPCLDGNFKKRITSTLSKIIRQDLAFETSAVRLIAALRAKELAVEWHVVKPAKISTETAARSTAAAYFDVELIEHEPEPKVKQNPLRLVFDLKDLVPAPLINALQPWMEQWALDPANTYVEGHLDVVDFMAGLGCQTTTAPDIALPFKISPVSVWPLF